MLSPSSFSSWWRVLLNHSLGVDVVFLATSFAGESATANSVGINSVPQAQQLVFQFTVHKLHGHGLGMALGVLKTVGTENTGHVQILG